MALTSPSRTDVNRTAILARLGGQGPASRADLARMLGVSPALVTQLTRDLLAEGLIEELDTSTSQGGGRPARMLGVVARTACAIGVKVVADHVAFVEVGIDGSVLRSATEPFDAMSPLATSALIELARTFIEAGGDNRLLGIGVGIPGTVDEQGIGVVDSTQLRWNQVPLGASLRRALDLPVVVENNVNALSVAERLFGQGRDCADFLVVTIGTGVGAGIVSGGSILRGRAGGAGDIGHIPVAEGGPLCQCGNHGCLEAFVGESALVATAVRDGVVNDGADIRDVREAADAGNAAAVRVFDDAGRLLGRTLAGVVNMLDPELVVILGEGVEAWDHWSPSFEPALRASLVPGKRGVEVAVETWQDDRWAQGAAALVLATPFDTHGVAGEQGRLMRERLVSSAGVRP
ncbi:ROK family transcriptional regulator [Leifsonia sp. PS1209]|uniref:ROK family transcriptional regulator n=1 Tax=Leifsonia sp. PS1209 TaxID=2724914 RepID=UPI001442C8CC|nr:ROK family transcriptional regulator [Leifsonia sp. PS1209]QJA00300.1 ROK family protein [Leifsonia sp. PS1209]